MKSLLLSLALAVTGLTEYSLQISTHPLSPNFSGMSGIYSSGTYCGYLINGKFVDEETFKLDFPNFTNWDFYKCKSKGAM